MIYAIFMCDTILNLNTGYFKEGTYTNSRKEIIIRFL